MRFDEGHESPDLINRRGEGGGGGGPGLAGIAPFLPLLLRVSLRVAHHPRVRRLLRPEGHRDRRYPPGGAGRARRGEAPERARPFRLVRARRRARRLGARNQSRNRPYRHAKLVLFTDATQTGCGFGNAATGPFYCPNDERVYIDLGFFHELSERSAPAVSSRRRTSSPTRWATTSRSSSALTDAVSGAPRGPSEGATGASVRLELQADCFAGVWAHSAAQRNLLEAGRSRTQPERRRRGRRRSPAAQATGTVSPESWTHGSSAERGRWFHRGYDTGNMDQCDTFSANPL